jgi:hypothetical protein
MTIDPEDFAGCRAYWLAGLCPCCGGELDDWVSLAGDVVDPEAIGEGVMLCGRCTGNEHAADPEFRDAMLAAILPPGLAVAR